MVLDEAKSKELKELLAEAFQTGLETVQQLLDTAHEPEMRLQAVKALYKLVKHCGPVLQVGPVVAPVNPAVVEKPAVSERDVSQLLADVMETEEDKELAEAPVKLAPAPAKPAVRSAPQEKLVAPPPKPKPKPATADEDAEPRVNRKYLVALGALAAAFAIYLIWPSGAVTPAGLASTALSSSDAETRRLAAVNLCMLNEPEILPQLRRVVKESKDPEVTATVVAKIFRFGRPEDIGEQYALLDSPDEKVRVAAAAGFAAIYGDAVPDGLVYDPKGPPEERRRVARALKEKFDAVQKKAMDDLNASKK